jgi:hypothetical protein
MTPAGGFWFELIRFEEDSALINQDKKCLAGRRLNCQYYLEVRVDTAILFYLSPCYASVNQTG